MTVRHPVRNLENANAAQKLASNYESVHMALGIMGNAMFFVGSICFLFADPVQRIGTWLFIVGSLGMLIASVGSKLVKSIERDG